jgi:uncharacterized protein (DUF2141 family)
MTSRKPLLAWTLMLVWIATPTVSASAGQSRSKGIRIEVDGLRNDHGRLGCTIFSGPDGFPRDRSKARGRIWGSAIQNQHAECFFGNPPAGAYAVIVFHDENGDGKFNQNFLGFPLEGFGFSNNANPIFKAPSFDETAFQYDGNGVKEITIDMIYK